MSMAETGSNDFQTQLRYLKNDNRYEYEKPYGFKVPPDDFPHTNIEVEVVNDILIKDIRRSAESFTLEKNGFTVRQIKCNLSYEDYHSVETIQPYFRELEQLLLRLLGASRTEVFRHQIRKRHANWPIMTESVYKFDQPTTCVHVDATVQGLRQEVTMKHGSEEGNALLQGRVQWFNVWKPLRTQPGGLRDWPLLFSDAEAIDKNRDFVPADLVYPTYATENTLVYHRSDHKWYYLDGHHPDEVIIFKQADSDEESCAGVPHCSAHNPLASADEPPRESIEARFLVYYD